MAIRTPPDIKPNLQWVWELPNLAKPRTDGKRVKPQYPDTEAVLAEIHKAITLVIRRVGMNSAGGRPDWVQKPGKGPIIRLRWQVPDRTICRRLSREDPRFGFCPPQARYDEP